MCLRHRDLLSLQKAKGAAIAVFLESDPVLFAHKFLLAPNVRRAGTDSRAAAGWHRSLQRVMGPVPAAVMKTPTPKLT